MCVTGVRTPEKHSRTSGKPGCRRSAVAGGPGRTLRPSFLFSLPVSRRAGNSERRSPFGGPTVPRKLCAHTVNHERSRALESPRARQRRTAPRGQRKVRLRPPPLGRGSALVNQACGLSGSTASAAKLVALIECAQPANAHSRALREAVYVYPLTAADHLRQDEAILRPFTKATLRIPGVNRHGFRRHP